VAEIATKYTLRSELGRGGVCVVFEAVHRLTGRSVAVKRLLPEMRAREDVRARLFREAAALGAIRHPNVVDIFDAGEEDDGAPFIVLERLHGRSLEGILAARTRLELKEALNIAWQTCAALAASHAVAVVHRDVKPENLILCSDDLSSAQLKLIDYGIATAPRGFASPKITRMGSLVGTPEYMPPELLAKSHAPSPAADVFAVGVTLFECLAGRVPIPGDAAQIREKWAQSPPPPMDVFCKDLPRSLSALVARALAKDPERRFSSAQAMAEAIRQVAGEIAGAPPMTLSAMPRIDVERRSQRTQQRRRTRRAPYRTPVRLEYGEAPVDARSEDLSRGGMFALVIPHGPPPTVGTRAAMRFALPSTGEMTNVTGIVRWTKPRDNGSIAVGLEFINLDPRAQKAVDQFVEILGQDVDV